MKAIYIPGHFDPTIQLDILNRELKDVTSIELDINVNQEYGGDKLLIVNNITRKDKLEKLSKISDEKGTTDNSI